MKSKRVRFTQITSTSAGIGGDPIEGGEVTFPPALFALDADGQVWAYEFSGKDKNREWYRFRMPKASA